MIKTLKNIFKQDKERYIVPKGVQDAIPVTAVYDDGIFRHGRDKFSKTFKFTDINYAVAGRENKEAMLLEYSELLNSLDSGATTKITINNRRLNRLDFENTILIPKAGDMLDTYREEYNEMLIEKATGANSIVQEKYMTISINKKSIEDARTYFARIGADLIAHFSRLGSKCTELEIEERLRIFYDFFRQGEETVFHFNVNETCKKGHDFKDYICPDSMEINKDYFMIGDRYGRVLFLREYASYIKDDMVAELTDLNRNLMMSIDIIPVPTDEAVKEAENRLLGVETNITNWQRRQNSNNNFSATVPYDMEQQKKEMKEFLDDLTTRDQRMMFAVVTMVHVQGLVNDLKFNIPSNIAYSSYVINGSWDPNLLTINPSDAKNKEQLIFDGGSISLSGTYDDLRELRINAQSAQLIGNYPDLEYIYMNSWGNLNLAGNFKSLKGVYMPGGQLLIGTSEMGFAADGVDIVNENGTITVYTSKGVLIKNSNIVTNAKIAIRGKGKNESGSRFIAENTIFAANNTITFGDMNDLVRERMSEVPTFYSQSGISIVNCNFHLLQGAFVSRNGDMILTDTDVDVFRGFLFSQIEIKNKDSETSIISASEGVYVEGKSFNLVTGLENESYQPCGYDLGTIKSVKYADLPKKFILIDGAEQFIDDISSVKDENDNYIHKYTIGKETHVPTSFESMIMLDEYNVATGDIKISADTIYSLSDTGQSLIASKNGDIHITGDYLEYTGVIYAPNGNVYIDNTTTVLNGRIFAKSITFAGSNLTITPTSYNMLNSYIWQDYDALEIGFNDPDTQRSITQDIILPTNGQSGSSVTWISGKQNIISTNGSVTRPQNNTEVLMSGIITKRGQQMTKDFDCLVLKQVVLPDLKDLRMDDIKEMNPQFDTLIYSGDKDGYLTGINHKYSPMKIYCVEEAIHSLNSVKTMMGFKNPASEFKSISTTNDGIQTWYRLQQVYNGVTVINRQLIVSVYNNEADGISGCYKRDINISISPQISEQTAINRYMSNINDDNVQSGGLYIYIDDNDQPKLIWALETDTATAYIDANTADVLYESEQVPLLDEKTVTDHHSGNITVNVENLGTNYLVKDDSRNITVYDGAGLGYNSHIKNDIYGTVIEVNDSDFDAKKATKEADALQALSKFTFTYDYYNNILNRNSVDNNGIPIDIVVNMPNSDWNHNVTNGAWMSNNEYGTVAKFGFTKAIEDNRYASCWSMDVCGHEFTHGIIDYKIKDNIFSKKNSGFCKSPESSSLDESYADIIGEIIERQYRRESGIIQDNLWLHSDDSFTYSGGNTRIMSNPIVYTGEFTGESHDGASYIDYAAYQMWSKGFRDDNNSNNEGTNEQEYAKIWYNSLERLYSNATFMDCRNAVLAETYRVYEGIDWRNKLRNTLDAFEAAGLKYVEPSITIEPIYDEAEEEVELSCIISGKVTTAAKDSSKRVGYKNVKVSLIKNEKSIRTTKTDSQGNYMFQLVDDGEYSLELTKTDSNGDPEAFERIGDIIVDGDKKITLPTIQAFTISQRISKCGEVKVKCKFKANDDKSVSSIPIVVYRGINYTSGERTAVLTTNSKGECDLSELGPGNYTIIAGSLSLGIEPIQKNIQLYPNEDETIEFKFDTYSPSRIGRKKS